jgi:hypothetical protein
VFPLAGTSSRSGAHAGASAGSGATCRLTGSRIMRLDMISVISFAGAKSACGSGWLAYEKLDSIGQIVRSMIFGFALGTGMRARLSVTLIQGRASFSASATPAHRIRGDHQAGVLAGLGTSGGLLYQPPQPASPGSYRSTCCQRLGHQAPRLAHIHRRANRDALDPMRSRQGKGGVGCQGGLNRLLAVPGTG